MAGVVPGPGEMLGQPAQTRDLHPVDLLGFGQVVIGDEAGMLLLPVVATGAGSPAVLEPLGRPDLLAGCRRSEVAPAHAFVVSSRAKTRRKR